MSYRKGRSALKDIRKSKTITKARKSNHVFRELWRPDYPYEHNASEQKYRLRELQVSFHLNYTGEVLFSLERWYFYLTLIR